MSHLDWVNLKNQYITGNWVTVSEFFNANKIKNNSRNRTQTKGWKNERLDYMTKVNVRTQIKSVEANADIKARHHLISKKLQLKGLEGLAELTIESVDEARKMIVSGLQEERIALGIEDTKGKQNLTQVNVNLPRTKFDDMIEGKTYQEILQLIAEIHREKERRVNNALV